MQPRITLNSQESLYCYGVGGVEELACGELGDYVWFDLAVLVNCVV
jgi:hypothetical protein